MSMLPKPGKLRLIEIDRNFKRSKIHWENPVSLLQTKSSVIEPNTEFQDSWLSIGKASARMRMFREQVELDSSMDAEKWKSVKTRFCVLIMEDLVWWSSEVLYLVPLVPSEEEEGSFAYYTIRPIAPYQEHRVRLLLREKSSFHSHGTNWKEYHFFFYSKEETPEELYDGISNMFGDIDDGMVEISGNVYENPTETQRTLVFTTKCDWDEDEQLVYVPQSQMDEHGDIRRSTIYYKKYGSQRLIFHNWVSENAGTTWFNELVPVQSTSST